MRVTPEDGSVQFTHIAGSGTHFCGLTVDSLAYCWGTNIYGALGDGTTQTKLNPVRVQGDSKFATIAPSTHSTCGLDGGGKAYCWGRNDPTARLGIGVSPEGSFEVHPVPVKTQRRFLHLGDMCGVNFFHRTYCWGGNWGGSFGSVHILPGNCSTFYYEWWNGDVCLVPTPLETEIRFKQVAGNCGLSEDGLAYCWGQGVGGSLGNGTVDGYAISPEPVSGGVVFSQLAGGGTHFCGLDLDGRAYCWGNNALGQLGIGESGSEGGESIRTVPTPVLTTQRFRALATAAHSCGLTFDDEVWCWGPNVQEEVGPGVIGHQLVPVRVNLPPLH